MIRIEISGETWEDILKQLSRTPAPAQHDEFFTMPVPDPKEPQPLEPVATEAPVTEAPVKTATMEDARKALAALKDAKGVGAIREMLDSYGVRSFVDLDPAFYPVVVEAVEVMLHGA